MCCSLLFGFVGMPSDFLVYVLMGKGPSPTLFVQSLQSMNCYTAESVHSEYESY